MSLEPPPRAAWAAWIAAALAGCASAPIERMPRWLYDPRRIVTLDVTMEELLARYLRRLSSAAFAEE